MPEAIPPSETAAPCHDPAWCFYVLRLAVLKIISPWLPWDGSHESMISTGCFNDSGLGFFTYCIRFSTHPFQRFFCISKESTSGTLRSYWAPSQFNKDTSLHTTNMTDAKTRCEELCGLEKADWFSWYKTLQGLQIFASVFEPRVRV